MVGAYKMTERRQQLGIVGKISIATLIAVGVHLFGVVWWASGLTHRVEQLEHSLSKQDSVIERIAVIEANVCWIRAELERGRGQR